VLVEILDAGKVVASASVANNTRLASFTGQLIVPQGILCISAGSTIGGVTFANVIIKHIPGGTIEGPGPIMDVNSASGDLQVRWRPIAANALVAGINSCDITISGSPTGITLSNHQLVESDHGQHGIASAGLAAQTLGNSAVTVVSDLGLGGQYGDAVDFAQAGKIGTLVVDPLSPDVPGSSISAVIKTTSGQVVAATG